MLCFLSLKNPHIDKQSAGYHWQYFLKTDETKKRCPPIISKKPKEKPIS